MSRPTLSVVVPNYNHARFLRESLSAILSQSERPLEVLVIDDGSTDDSISVIEEAARRDPLVRLVRHERNLGVERTINEGAALSRGDCLYFAGADDRVLPGFFRRSIDMLAAHPRAGFCCSLGVLLGPDGADLGPVRTPIVSSHARYFSPDEALRLFLRRGNWVLTNTVIFRRFAFEQAGGWDETIRAAGDALLIFPIAARQGACFVPERLASWRKLDDSVGQREAADLDSGLNTLDALEARLRSPRLRPILSDRFLAWWKKTAFAAALYEFARRRPRDAEGLGRIAARLPGVRARLYGAALRACPRAAPALTKAFLFSLQDSGARREIVRGKIRRLLGRR